MPHHKLRPANLVSYLSNSSHPFSPHLLSTNFVSPNHQSPPLPRWVTMTLSFLHLLWYTRMPPTPFVASVRAKNGPDPLLSLTLLSTSALYNEEYIYYFFLIFYKFIINNFNFFKKHIIMTSLACWSVYSWNLTYSVILMPHKLSQRSEGFNI